MVFGFLTGHLHTAWGWGCLKGAGVTADSCTGLQPARWGERNKLHWSAGPANDRPQSKGKPRCGPRTFLTCRTDVKLNMTIKSDSLHPKLTVFTSIVLLLIDHINHWTRIGWRGSCCVFTVSQRISEELRTTDTSMARIFILTFVYCETCLMCSSNVRPFKSDRSVYSTYCTCFK